ncbi:MAG: hypothetical protein ACE5EH_07290 [Gammaproteobacteria bacterium]
MDDKTITNVDSCESTVRLLSFVVWALLMVGQAHAFELLDTSGNIGYTYRSLESSGDDEAVSNQVQAAVHANSYLWQPWISTLSAGLTFTRDSTELNNSSSNDTNVVTGELNLNVLPQSRSPFMLSYRKSDSRVDTFSAASPLTTLGSKEFETTRLGLKQSYTTEQGHRFQARYDTNSWDDNAGETYDDDLVGLEMNMQFPKQTIVAKTSKQTTDHSQSDRHADNFVFNVDHFYYPTREIRIDSMLSRYDSDVTSTPPLNGTNQGDSETALSQVSSFLFWRPVKQPITVSGGLRIYDLNGSTVGNSTEMFSINATAGTIYQFTKNLRFDANINLNNFKNEDKSTDSANERAEVLYQSDIRNIFSGFNHQWYASGEGSNQSSNDVDQQMIQARLGHDANRSWALSEMSSLRVSLSQSVNQVQVTGNVGSNTSQLNHSGSIGWDMRHGEGMTYVHLTLSDGRYFGDNETDRQFFNFQALRNQTIDRKSSLSGNLTVQSVRQQFNGMGDEKTTTTTTGQINYQHSRIFSVPQLRFMSDLRISRASLDDGVDRTEWENRIDYTIGLLDSRLSWRWVDTSREDFNLLYFQVTRRF